MRLSRVRGHSPGLFFCFINSPDCFDRIRFFEFLITLKNVQNLLSIRFHDHPARYKYRKNGEAHRLLFFSREKRISLNTRKIQDFAYVLEENRYETNLKHKNRIN